MGVGSQVNFLKYEERFYPAKAQRRKGKILSARIADRTGYFLKHEGVFNFELLIMNFELVEYF